MAISDPIVNFRAPVAAKEAAELYARRRGFPDAGKLKRDYFLEGLFADLCMELTASVGVQEVLIRLSRPSYPSHDTERSAEIIKKIEQTA